VIQTEYLERWGFPWEFYAPFLQFAQAHELPVLALNAPAEITRQVAREGLASLAGDDLRYIPPLTEIDTSNADYRAFVAEAFGAHGDHGGFNLDNFFAAQVMWDETMAMTIADFKTANPDTQVVVLAGNGHVIYGHGIPDRVERRLGDDLAQQIVILNPIDFFKEEGGAIADAFWYSD
ncbi:MAG: ChaN family lipoprotein, partial [Cyanobacteria bacterium P01_C01_bin.147]